MDDVILAGFQGEINSAQLVVEKVRAGCHKLIIPNDKEKTVRMLLDEIKEKEAVCVVIIGQKPNIADKIAVEPCAKGEKGILRTSLDVTASVELLKSLGYKAYISKGCGTSYCNHVYYNCLLSGVNCIFLHIPTLSCISDISALTAAIEGYIEGLSGVPAAL